MSLPSAPTPQGSPRSPHLRELSSQPPRGFAQTPAFVSAAQLLALGREGGGDKAVAFPSWFSPKGASHLGLADLGNRTGRANARQGNMLQEPSWPGGKGHTREPLWTGVILLGRGYGLEQRAPVLSRAHREAGGAKACQAREREGWPEAQRGGQRSSLVGAQGPLGPLDTMS